MGFKYPKKSNLSNYYSESKENVFSFAKGFKRVRKETGYTQQTFSDVFTIDGNKISIETVRNWEQGKTFPEVSTILELCKFFKCDIDYLFNGIDCRKIDNQYISNLTALNEKSITALKEFQSLNMNLQISAINNLLCYESGEWLLQIITEYLQTDEKEEFFVDDGDRIKKSEILQLRIYNALADFKKSINNTEV